MDTSCRFDGEMPSQLDEETVASLSADQLNTLFEYLHCQYKHNVSTHNNDTSIDESLFSDKELHQHLLATYSEFRAVHFMQTYLSPILIFLGVLGNGMSFFEFRLKTRRRLKSTTLLFCTLALMDTLVLLVGLFGRWLQHMTGLTLKQHYWAFCKAENFVLFGSAMASSWLIVAITWERFLAIRKPLQARRIATVSLARRLAIGIPLLAYCANSHFWVTVTMNTHAALVAGSDAVRGDVVYNETYEVCGPLPRYSFFLTNVWPWLDAVFYSILPLVIMLLMNLAICKLMRQRDLKIKRLNGTKRDLGKCVDHPNRLRRKLVTVSMTFVFSTVPLTSFMIWQALSGGVSVSHTNTIEDKLRKLLIRTIAEMLMYFHHAANFYLYCLSSRYFRQDLKNTVFKRDRHVYMRHTQSSSLTSFNILSSMYSRQGLNSVNYRQSTL